MADRKLEPVSDPGPIAWFAERLWDWEGIHWEGFHKVGQWMPEGFDRYARLLHPAYHADEDKDVPWSRVAAWSGRDLRPTVAFEDLATRDDGNHWSAEGSAPERGGFDRSMCARLASVLQPFTSTPQTTWLCVKSGSRTGQYGSAIEITPRSGRRYLLLRGPVESVTGLEFEVEGLPLVQVRGWWDRLLLRLRPPPAIRRGRFISPSFWWPEDRAWFVSTEIDAVSTYIGGSSELIDRLLVDQELEVLPARIEDPLDGFLPESGPAN